MQCSCGSEAVWRSHEVKELPKAQEWYADVVEGDLPIIVNRTVCNACGRQMMRPYDKSTTLVKD